MFGFMGRLCGPSQAAQAVGVGEGHVAPWKDPCCTGSPSEPAAELGSGHQDLELLRWGLAVPAEGTWYWWVQPQVSPDLPTLCGLLSMPIICTSWVGRGCSVEMLSVQKARGSFP